MLVLDSGGVSFLAKQTPQTAAVLRRLRAEGVWPPLVPTPVLVECVTGSPGIDAPVNRLLKCSVVREELPISVARRAGYLRTWAQRGSAVDAVVVALAEPAGAVLTSDATDIGALVEHAADVNFVVV
jgi:hypothetical protein